MPAGPPTSADTGPCRPGRWRRGTGALVAAVVVLSPAGATVAADGAHQTVATGGRAAPGAASVAATADEGGGVRPVPGEVLADFDPPDSPYGPGQRGVRLAAADGASVRAARAGTVAFAGPVAGTPWVSVDHGGGLRTSYGPVEPAVAAGERVAAGEVLGRLAAGDEPGLHWGARLQGAYIDPMSLLGRWRPVLVPRR